MTGDKLLKAIERFEAAEIEVKESREAVRQGIRDYLGLTTRVRGDMQTLADKLGTTTAVLSNYKNGWGSAASADFARKLLVANGDAPASELPKDKPDAEKKPARKKPAKAKTAKPAKAKKAPKAKKPAAKPAKAKKAPKAKKPAAKSEE